MTLRRVPQGVETPLKRYIKRAFPLLPESYITNALREKGVRVNGVRRGPDAIIRSGDEIQVYFENKFINNYIQIIHRADSFLAVEKPRGLPVDVDADGIGEDTLIARARREFPDARLCHRLDVGTGGVAILSLDDNAHEEILRAFREREVEKKYRCVVKGAPNPLKGEIKGYVSKDPAASRATASARRAKDSLTAAMKYETATIGARASELIATPITGRTHQIRVQLASIGNPILGDDKYGDRTLNRALGFKAPLLWCESITLLGVTARSEARFPHWDK